MSDDLHSLSGAYVLDALTDEERADFEIHLDRCPTCRDEVASLREVAPLLAETVAVQPPPSLRADILARARETRQDPPEVASEEPEAPPAEPSAPLAQPTPLRHRRGWVALAAAAALVVGGGITWQVVDQVTTSASEEVAGADDARTWQGETTDGASVVVTRSERMGQAVLRVEGLHDPGEGRAYQAWLQGDDGKLAPAGMMAGDGEMMLDGDVMDAKGVGVSVEPAAGSTQPTSDPIAMVELG